MALSHPIKWKNRKHFQNFLFFSKKSLRICNPFLKKKKYVSMKIHMLAHQNFRNSSSNYYVDIYMYMLWRACHLLPGVEYRASIKYCVLSLKFCEYILEFGKKTIFNEYISWIIMQILSNLDIYFSCLRHHMHASHLARSNLCFVCPSVQANNCIVTFSFRPLSALHFYFHKLFDWRVCHDHL